MRGRRIALRRRAACSATVAPFVCPRATLLTGLNIAALAEPRDQARIPLAVVFARPLRCSRHGSPPCAGSMSTCLAAPGPFRERRQHHRRA